MSPCAIATRCLLLLLVLPGPAGVASAAEASWRTHLLDAYVGSRRSAIADELGQGGYELADGTYRPLAPWYQSDWRDVTLLMMTEVDRNVGLIWGVSTGEAGEKYVIDPALHIGLMVQRQIGDRTWISIKGTVVLGGDLVEFPCVADYGAIGGIQPVNCRLAAETLPPAETLQYLAHERGWRESRVTVIFEHRF